MTQTGFVRLSDFMSGTREKAESLLISIRALNSIFDRLLVSEALVDDIEYVPADDSVRRGA